MKSILLSSVAVLAVSTAVKAADLGTYEPVNPRSLYDWTGLYGGVSIGWMGAKAKHALEITELEPANPLFELGEVFTRTNDPDGGLFGGYAGYNWQVEGTGLVLGIEGDIYGSNTKESNRRDVFADIDANPANADVLVGSIHTRDKVTSTWAVRARIGWAIENFMPYIAGGYAGAKMKTRVNTTVTDPDNFLPVPPDPLDPPVSDVTSGSTNTYQGWTIGAGAEWMMTPNWLVRGDYQYKQLGNAKTTASASDTFIYDLNGIADPDPIEVDMAWRNRTKLKSHQFTVGTSFKF